jgi:pimeloyl-ACP methyl ester carboxylesterase
MEYFAKTHQVIRFDQRGFGKTTTATQTINRRADLRALLDHLNIERAIVMGCSFGGALALDFTLESPERVAALILIAAGISGVDAPQEIRDMWKEQDAAYEAGDFERVVDLELKMWVDGPKRSPEQVPAHVRDKVRAMELDNLKITNTDYQSAPLEPPAVTRLQEIQTPTLVMYGTGDQPLVIANGEQLAREIPNAHVVIYENVGHVPSMEIPNEVNRALENFLQTRAQ